MVHAVSSGHPGGSLGCVEYLVALYKVVMKHDPAAFTMDGKNEDLFFLSNGHISPVFYSVLARAGYFPVEELKTQFPLVADPPIPFPVTLNVPEPEHNAADPDPVLAPVHIPTILAVAGDAAENVKQFIDAVALLCVTFAVNVTPEFKINVPVPVFEISVQVTFAVIVTV